VVTLRVPLAIRTGRVDRRIGQPPQPTDRDHCGPSADQTHRDLVRCGGHAAIVARPACAGTTGLLSAGRQSLQPHYAPWHVGADSRPLVVILGRVDRTGCGWPPFVTMGSRRRRWYESVSTCWIGLFWSVVWVSFRHRGVGEFGSAAHDVGAGPSVRRQHPPTDHSTAYRRPRQAPQPGQGPRRTRRRPEYSGHRVRLHTAGLGPARPPTRGRAKTRPSPKPPRVAASYFEGNTCRYSISIGACFRRSDIVADALCALPGATQSDITTRSLNALVSGLRRAVGIVAGLVSSHPSG
jgi:hypothetical protein